MNRRFFSLITLAFAVTLLTMPLIAAEKPVEGPTDAFRGEAKFEIQSVFEGGRQPNVVVAMDGTVLATFKTADALQVRRSEDGGKTWGDPITLGKYKNLLAIQRPGGNWPPAAATCGPCWTTAMAILAMTPPYRQLPIYQRDDAFQNNRETGARR